jgi:hypothetical protein
MDIYQTIEFIAEKIKEDQKQKSDPLYGISIETDPYTELSKLVPVVLIEAERTELITHEHIISFTQIVSAQTSGHKEFKSKVTLLTKKVIDKLLTINSIDISPRHPQQVFYSEIMIGSLKCSAATFDAVVKASW